MAGKQGSYSGDPSTTEKDRVRFEIQDTECENFKFSDAEIEYLIAQGGDLCSIKSSLFETLAAQFADKAQVTVGSVSKNFQQISDNYRKQAKECLELADKQVIPNVTPFFGGRTKSGNLILDQDPDAIQPKFPLDIGNNYRANQLQFEVGDENEGAGNGV